VKKQELQPLPDIRDEELIEMQFKPAANGSRANLGANGNRARASKSAA
jgi:hypothetical protein